MKALREIRRVATLPLLVAALGTIGSIASIESGWGKPGMALSVFLSFAILWSVWRTLRPVLQRTHRGTTLLEAVTRAGLFDIENREDESIQSLPPVAFYKTATAEVLITGITGYRTFDQHIAIIETLLKAGKRVRVLLLNPKCEDAKAMTETEQKDIPAEIEQALDMAARGGLFAMPGFEVALVDQKLPYTAVMIDGDLCPLGSNPLDGNGQLRIQPSTLFKTQHRGLVIQLQNTAAKSGFDYFADDLRNVWKTALQYRPSSVGPSPKQLARP